MASPEGNATLKTLKYFKSGWHCHYFGGQSKSSNCHDKLEMQSEKKPSPNQHTILVSLDRTLNHQPQNMGGKVTDLVAPQQERILELQI